MLLFSDNLTIPYIVAVIVAVLVGMTVHEFAHNYVAHLMGDPTPSRLGRLTLNPMAHIYWPGFLMFVVIGFGTIGLAPINGRLMRNPRWGYMAAVAAGPLSNLLLAIIFGLIMRFIGLREFVQLPELLYWFLLMMVTFNLLGFVFNLLPLFPLDGWHITLALLPPDLAYSWQKNAQNTQFILFAIIVISFVVPRGSSLDPISVLITDPIISLRHLIVGF